MNLPLMTNVHEFHVRHYLLKLVRKPNTKTFECESVIFSHRLCMPRMIWATGKKTNMANLSAFD